jgi:dCMP deaminase
MILDDMRKGFLIIGFTGPLRSGCTTGAEYLVANLRERLSNWEKETEKHQREIWGNYKTIKTRKGEGEEYIKLSDRRKNLLSDIKARQVLKTLAKYKNDSPRYISLTAMLLKTTVESLWDGMGLIIDDKTEPKEKEKQEERKDNCGTIISEIEKSDFDKYKEELIGKGKDSINNIIKERRYHKFGFEEADGKSRIDTYENYIKAVDNLQSDLRKAFVEKYGPERSIDRLREALQDMGDNIRKCGNPFDFRTAYDPLKNKCLWKLSEQANDVIKYYRNRYRFWENQEQYKEFLNPNIFVIESFRNPVEVEYFRYRYYEFFLISVHCNHKVRLKREIESYNGKLGINLEKVKEYFEKANKRDTGVEIQHDNIYMQNVRSAVFLSDIAIINEEPTKDSFYNKIIKFYALIRQPGCIQPTNDEMFMQAAYSMSLRSRCISRKVGAVIVGEKGYVVGGGWNDVGEGQIGCGDRTIGDIFELANEYIPMYPTGKEGFIGFIKDRYNGKNLCDSICFRQEYNDYNKFLTGSDENSKPQQFCRALHAEENALLQNSKIGGVGVQNGTIYTTTFPCELCAKKIYQAGIRKIIFNEPYPESIAEEVFLRDGIRRVDIQPFEGVKSHSYYRLYRPFIDTKEYQKFE